ncbi:MAG TPA: hypothetical protein VMT11_09895 [Myxococcaceae bacterium]|nr:hypothetical protein [Myxococcaceae bacterium]
MQDDATEEALRQAVGAVGRMGMLFLHDARKPSLTALVAGEPIRGSWWGHPAGRRIFQVASALEERGDVLFVPLLSAKVTLVHRRLWPALISVGEARAPWQMDPLTPHARELLGEVERAGRVRASGPSSKVLARSLLVHAGQVHTEAASHATELVSWSEVRRRHSIDQRLAPQDARSSLETTASQLGALSALPWKRMR